VNRYESLQSWADLEKFSEIRKKRNRKNSVKLGKREIGKLLGELRLDLPKIFICRKYLSTLPKIFICRRIGR